MRQASDRLRDILEAIERIQRHTVRGREAFANDELLQTWVIHHLLIIGEACRALPDALRAQHRGVPWPEIVGMRNALVHRYFEIDRELVWEVVVGDLPDSKWSSKRCCEKAPEPDARLGGHPPVIRTLLTGYTTKVDDTGGSGSEPGPFDRRAASYLSHGLLCERSECRPDHLCHPQPVQSRLA